LAAGATGTEQAMTLIRTIVAFLREDDLSQVQRDFLSRVVVRHP
jgi:hypothetical protein